MKNFRFTIFTLLFVSAVLFSACGENQNNKTEAKDTLKTEVIDQNKTDNLTTDKIVEEIKKDSTIVEKVGNTKYVCPQGCKEGAQAKPGTCPSCEMDLIENLDFKE